MGTIRHTWKMHSRTPLGKVCKRLFYLLIFIRMTIIDFLHRLLDCRFNKIALSDLGTDISIASGITTVKSKERLNIELGALEDLDLADVDVLQGEDTLASLLNAVANDVLSARR